MFAPNGKYSDRNRRLYKSSNPPGPPTKKVRAKREKVVFDRLDVLPDSTVPEMLEYMRTFEDPTLELTYTSTKALMNKYWISDRVKPIGRDTVDSQRQQSLLLLETTIEYAKIKDDPELALKADKQRAELLGMKGIDGLTDEDTLQLQQNRAAQLRDGGSLA